MLTLRGSAALLGAANSHDALVNIARVIGFEGTCTEAGAELQQSIGLPPNTVATSVVQGTGSLRALIVVVPPGSSMREMLARLSTRLGSKTPHILWLVIACEAHGAGVAIGAPTIHRRHAKIAALLADRGRIMDSDAETFRMLVAARGLDDLATHARFVEVLGRDALSRRFFRTLDSCVASLAASASVGADEARHEIALLHASRLLFLGFLEAKGWLDGDPGFLARLFDDTMGRGGEFHGRVLLPLFFGTLNTPIRQRAARAREFGRIPFLNGGLFTPTPVERRLRRLRFSDEALGRFFGELFSRYRFTAREETSSFEEAAIDPEMLGRTFECLMADRARQGSGVFYTPHELVERVTGCGLEQALAGRLGPSVADKLLRNAALSPVEAKASVMALDDLRILDPACGSGAFLVHALDRVALLHAQLGDPHPPATIRRRVLARSIFGVDINPTAVWLCQLRLWLSIVIDTRADDGAAIPPLPNLDRNIRIGDALAGEAFRGEAATGAKSLRTLRERYARSSGRRKSSLARTLDRAERRLLLATLGAELESVSAARRDLVLVRRGRDLFGERYLANRDEEKHSGALRERSLDLRRRYRAARFGQALAFSFPAHFADVADAGGFTLIVGNPPWVRPHRTDPHTRETYRQRFVVARTAAWMAGAESAGAGRGFSSQVDLAALFVERSLALLAPGAALSLLLPAKLWRSLAAGGLRRLVMEQTTLDRVEDYSDVPTAFDAAVYPGLLVATRPSRMVHEPPPSELVHAAVLHRARMATTWTTTRPALAWDDSPGAPWILIPPEVRRSFDLIRDAGMSMASSGIGRPLLGVKCGLNDAFVVDVVRARGNGCVVVSANGREAEMDRRFVRPVVRGEEVQEWRVVSADRSIVWPYDASGMPVDSLPPTLLRWFAPYRRALRARSDARGNAKWWTLFRTEAARHDLPRVVWADIGRRVRATVLHVGDPAVPLNTCYVARCPTTDDALALSALLNSSLMTSWLAVIAEPARGGYRRYLGWTMSLLPIPVRWDAHRPILADLARGAAELHPVSDEELLTAVLRAFELSRRDVEPLLAWSAE